MKKFINSKYVSLLYVIEIILLLTTDPQKLPVIALVVPFIIFFIATLFTTRNILRYLDKDARRLTGKKINILSVMIAAFPTACLLLQSVGQFSLRDLVTLVIIFFVLWIYVRRSSLA